MGTLVFRIDLSVEPEIDKAIVSACEFQREKGYKLASTFVWCSSLILIFQKL